MTATTPKIEFNEELHEYRVAGVRKPSVTTIIAAAGLIDDSHFTEESRERGKAVHAASHYLDEGDLDLSTVLGEHRPYLDAWVKFRNQTEFEPDRIEHRVYHSIYGYCGTLDRTGRFGDRSTAILDIKTGLEAAWHAIQIGAYSYALEQEGVKANSFRKMTVMLRRDGTFKVKEYPASEYRDNWNTFLSCLNLWNFRAEKMGGRR
jgi:hypothetical protein